MNWLKVNNRQIIVRFASGEKIKEHTNMLSNEVAEKIKEELSSFLGDFFYI
jgi:hypothetical protein